MLHRLVRVYTCQNARVLETTCRGSNGPLGHYADIESQNQPGHSSVDQDFKCPSIHTSQSNIYEPRHVISNNVAV